MDSSLKNYDTSTHDEQIINIIQQAAELAAQGQSAMQISCSEVEGADAGITLPCHHAICSPLLFSCIAAEGIKTLYIDGLDKCISCPKQEKTHFEVAHENYETISSAMANKLSIQLGSIPKQEQPKTTVEDSEPSRRTFFRKIIPTVAKHAADTVQQVAQAGITTPSISEEVAADTRQVPLLSKLFLRALPALHINHLPVPYMPSIALGSIQADDSCTACGDCITTCPSHALSLRAFGQNSILEFQADCCTGCNECASACPEKAIQLLPSINLPSLLNDKPRPLVMVQK